MKIHFYDQMNKNKIGLIDGDQFTSMTINHTIDDFSSCTMSHSISDPLTALRLQGLENIYVEDDNGVIIFGGVITGFAVNADGETITCYDHRWILSRLIIDEEVTLHADDDVLATIDYLVDIAKAKRNIPLEFNAEKSAINSDERADLVFAVGDNIASCLQKIIQTLYARWAVRYEKINNQIIGYLIVRSISNVTPEGVGIARTKERSEDGTLVTIFYGEGDSRSNVLGFDFNIDLSSYTARTKIGVKLNGDTQYFDSEPDEVSASFAYIFGITEGFATDYKANSEDTARSLAIINQTYPKSDCEVTLNPDFTDRFNCGDRVNLKIVSPFLEGVNDAQVRIDGITYTRKSGYFETKLNLNTMNPQKRTGTTGILEKISSLEERLDDLNQNYLKP